LAPRFEQRYARTMDSHFHAQNELELVLVRASTDPGARPAFYRRLLTAELFFLTPEPPPQEHTRMTHEGESMEIVCWDGPNGAFLPFFSSHERMMQVLGETGAGGEVPNYGFVRVTGRDAFTLLAQDPAEAVLNPGLPYAKPFSVDEIRAIANGTLLGGESITIEPSAGVVLGQPDVYPTELVDALRALFDRYDAVDAAFLAQIHDPNGGLPPHPIVGIVGVACGDAVQEAGMVASAIAEGPVDFVEMDPDEDQGIAGYLRRETAPFYVKQTLP
jgi:hypothetical protein